MPDSTSPSLCPLSSDCVPTFVSVLLVKASPLWQLEQFCAAKTACPDTAAAVRLPSGFRDGLRGVCAGTSDAT